VSRTEHRIAKALRKYEAAGISGIDLWILSSRLQGHTVVEIASELERSQEVIYRHLRRIRVQLHRLSAELEDDEWTAKQERIREVRVLLHQLSGDIWEQGILSHWRRATIGKKQRSRVIDRLGNVMLPGVKVFQPEDIVEELFDIDKFGEHGV